MSARLAALGLLSALLAWNAWRPCTSRRWIWPSFVLAWLATELALHLAALALFLTACAVWHGGLGEVDGVVGLAVIVAAWTALLVRHLVSVRIDVGLAADEPPRRVVRDHGVPRYPRSHVLLPPLAWRRRDVPRRRDVTFACVDGTELRLDVLGPVEPGARRPAVVQIHGGAWVGGWKRWQGVPLLGHLAAHGWVGFNVDYRLSPVATFPDHLVDVKRAIAWIRAHADELGVDPTRVAVTGGSAGGHLAALVGLTAGDRALQPGFEDADTSVLAVASFYGVYDLMRPPAGGPAAFHDFVEEEVFKRRRADDPEAFRRASPIARVRPDAPPFLVVAGGGDSIVPRTDALRFVAALRAVSAAPVVEVEVRAVEHAFDVVPTVRTLPLFELTERFLHAVATAPPGEVEGAVRDGLEAMLA